MYRGGWRVPGLGTHPRDYWLNVKGFVRILREIAHLRSDTLLFALVDVPEDHRPLSQRTSTNVNNVNERQCRTLLPHEYLSNIETNEIPQTRKNRL